METNSGLNPPLKLVENHQCGLRSGFGVNKAPKIMHIGVGLIGTERALFMATVEVSSSIKGTIRRGDKGDRRAGQEVKRSTLAH
jgi:hypothetical protein